MELDVDMWLDADGVFHTAAFADPRSVMSADFARSLERLARRFRGRRRIATLVSDLEEQMYELDPAEVMRLRDQIDNDLFAEQPAPDGLLSAPFDDLDGLRDLLATIPLRWRLDALFAVESALLR
ncbi:hypothetical protein [Nocardioides sp. L-11A]|uniref:hypothetical protein n=1 Tax=Nocardioides sp. L-11A TaxID=3043848 RepID=UPI00249AB298|nr:hypothetical protein QJ852_18820 [Nocardioides sp. L-11A]